MDTPELIKNISFSEVHVLRDLVDYQKGRIVSRTLAQNNALSLTLFAFDQGEGLSTHAAPGDAMVHQVLDGEVSLTIGNCGLYIPEIGVSLKKTLWSLERKNPWFSPSIPENWKEILRHKEVKERNFDRENWA